MWVILVAKTTKTIRYGGRGFGARVTVVSDPDIVDSKHKKRVDATWDAVIDSAKAAGKSVEAYFRGIIHSTRNKTGYMGEQFRVVVPSRASRGGQMVIDIGWPKWGKPLHYYDFQERGTGAHRTHGYGDKRYARYNVPGAGPLNKSVSLRSGHGNGGITPMGITPAAVRAFRSTFEQNLKEVIGRRG